MLPLWRSRLVALGRTRRQAATVRFLVQLAAQPQAYLHLCRTTVLDLPSSVVRLPPVQQGERFGPRI